MLLPMDYALGNIVDLLYKVVEIKLILPGFIVC